MDLAENADCITPTYWPMNSLRPFVLLPPCHVKAAHCRNDVNASSSSSCTGPLSLFSELLINNAFQTVITIKKQAGLGDNNDACNGGSVNWTRSDARKN